MKTLILCVDRDDDLGHKANVETPLVGRRRNVEAATALGIADPEDSDTNAIFAAVNLYDRELRRAQERGHQVEVASIAGHRVVGLKSDRRLAAELDEVLELVRPDEVVLVSDGAEDEQIIPILQGRVPVAHVHRSVVKQAPRLEGFYYVLTRMLDDDKFAKRFVLPFSLVLLVWGAAFFLDILNYAWGATLAILGLWLFVHAMRWEDRVSRFFRDMGEGLRGGKVTIISNAVMILLLALGVVEALERLPTGETSGTLRALFFLQEFLLYLVSAFLVRTAGQLFDEWIRVGRASVRYWTTAFTLIAFGFIGSVAIDLAISLIENQPLTRLLSFDMVVRLFVGLAVAMGGIILAKYVRNFFQDVPPQVR